MTTPKDRDALIEFGAQAMWNDTNDRGSWFDVPNDVREIYRSNMRALLTALESSGCFVGPVVATERMCDAGEGFNLRCGCPDCDMEAWEKVAAGWTAMQSANPYRKDPSQ